MELGLIRRVVAAAPQPTIKIELASSLLSAVKLTEEQFIAESKLILALKFFERGDLSSGQAAELCGLNRIDFIIMAGRQGIPAAADLDDDELSRELRALPNT